MYIYVYIYIHIICSYSNLFLRKNLGIQKTTHGFFRRVPRPVMNPGRIGQDYWWLQARPQDRWIDLWGITSWNQDVMGSQQNIVLRPSKICIYVYMYICIYVYMYIYIYARGPRFPQSILVLTDPHVKNHCFAKAKCGFCTFFFLFL